MGVVALRRRGASGRLATLALVSAALVLAGCGNRNANKAAAQTAVKVNKQEITVHQINFVLSQQRPAAPEQAASASKQVLERLIDQELALQNAEEQKLDREPRILQQIEAARRDIIARAYFEKIALGVPKPTPAEITAYYQAHPALFKERKLYSLQELAIEARPEQLAALRDKVTSSKDIPELMAFLKASDFKFDGNQTVRAAEQLPLRNLERFAAMKDGERVFNPTAQGAQVIVLAGTRSQPVDEQRATPAIEQFLLNERKRKMVEDDLKALRTASKIEYVGEFAKAASAGTVDAPAQTASEVPTMTIPAPAAATTFAPAATPQVEVGASAAQMASAPSTSAVDKGMGIKGLK